MSEYTATVHWQRQADEAFTDLRYHRRHALHFDGGAVVPGSSAPSSVPLPYSDPTAVDPEEALVASLSSCHMLCFLALAAKAGHVVEDYRDDATGVMTRNAVGKLAITTVTLRPVVRFGSGRQPTPEQHASLHHRAHEDCFIASSVKSDVRCEPSFAT